MIYMQLLWEFLKVGLFAFGGAYGAIPLMRDIVLSYGWMTDDVFTSFVAVSESTPGPIMVNMATYIGSSQAGFWGALLATVGVVLPSFIIILAATSVIKNLINNKYVQAILQGIRPSFIGIILAMGIYMVICNSITYVDSLSFEWQALVITIVLLAISFVYKHIMKKDFSPILLIICSMGMGIALYSFV